MSDVETVEISQEDSLLIRALLIALYGSQASSWQINSNLAQVVEVMLREMENCSDTFDYVPGPHGITKPGLTYIRKQLTKMMVAQTKRHVFQIKEQALPCKSFLALAWKSHIYNAAHGI